MALLDVKNVKKIYTTRFGGNQVEALRDVTFSVEPREWGVGLRQDYSFEYPGGPGPAHRREGLPEGEGSLGGEGERDRRVPPAESGVRVSGL